jgi:alpha-tubulin suppressor-like RCC1 family protein
MALTKIQAGSFAVGAIQTADLSSNTTAAFATSASFAEFATSLAPKVASVNVANSSFAVLDDTAVNVGGGYIVVTGTNFAEGVTVLVDTTAASAVTRVDSTTLRVQVPAKAASSYNLFVVNPDGGTGIRVSGVTYSANPSWVTTSPLTQSTANVAFNLALNATEATSYALASGSTLPTGTALLANGYFYGTVTIGSTTTYSFDVVATDAQNQESSKTFGITIVVPTFKLWAVGGNFSSELGLGTSPSVSAYQLSSPAQVGTDATWNSISAGGAGALAVKGDGTLWAWGFNAYGWFGTNNRTNSPVPTQIGVLTNWSKVSSGHYPNYGVLAVKTDGTLWAWGGGSNVFGVLGLNDAINRSSPVQVGALTNWSTVHAALEHTLAVKTDGTLWAWGNNDTGRIGNNSVVARSSPVQVGTDTNWSKIDGYRSSFAIKIDGTLWSWGTNTTLANSGLNDRVNRSSPTQVGASYWNEVSQGNDQALAVKSDGTLWVWGGEGDGAMGLNTSSPTRSSPTQIGTDTNWSKVDLSPLNCAYAVKTNGTLWSWGRNSDGTLGLGNTIARSSPTQVGTNTGWSNVKAGYNQVWFVGAG